MRVIRAPRPRPPLRRQKITIETPRPPRGSRFRRAAVAVFLADSIPSGGAGKQNAAVTRPLKSNPSVAIVTRIAFFSRGVCVLLCQCRRTRWWWRPGG